MILYKLGLFGMDWDHTPFLDNKAAPQRRASGDPPHRRRAGRHDRSRVRHQPDRPEPAGRPRRRRVRRRDLVFRPAPLRPEDAVAELLYRTGISSLRAFNDRLLKCEVVFNARADNLAKFVDRIASDLGSTSDILSGQVQPEQQWLEFDTRADDRFWFRLRPALRLLRHHEGHPGRLRVRHPDARASASLWDQLERQFQSALRIQPLIISNGREDGWIMPSHLTTMGFYMLRVRFPTWSRSGRFSTGRSQPDLRRRPGRGVPLASRALSLFVYRTAARGMETAQMPPLGFYAPPKAGPTRRLQSQPDVRGTPPWPSSSPTTRSRARPRNSPS